MAPLFASQPFKTIYTIFFLLKAPPHALVLFLYFLAKPSHPECNFNISISSRNAGHLLENAAPDNDIVGDAKTSLVSALLNMFFPYSTTTRSRYIIYDNPGKAKERLVTINPPPMSHLSGAIAPTATVKPAPVRGVWLLSAPLVGDIPKERVILYFPGGAFVLAVGHENSGRPTFEILTKHLHADRFLWAQYRLAASAETRFPAAIQDAVIYYHYVVSLGVDPNNIIISGD